MFLDMWKMGRTRLTNQFDNIDEADLLKRLDPDSGSVGWLLRHIAEVELLFAKNVFGKSISVKAQTIGSIAKDRGQFNDLQPLLNLIQKAEEELADAISAVDEWNEEVSTAEFGTVTKAEALGRILSHTAYHSGQLALAVKYGKPELDLKMMVMSLIRRGWRKDSIKDSGHLFFTTPRKGSQWESHEGTKNHEEFLSRYGISCTFASL